MMIHLRFLDYRYVRFCFHPLIDKFVLCSSLKDPKWTNVRSIRGGLDGDERYRREQVFGQNQIDIRQKSFLQLLIDEVNQNLSLFSSIGLTQSRLSILSMFSKFQVSYCGLSTSTIIMQFASSSSQSSVLLQRYWKPDQ